MPQKSQAVNNDQIIGAKAKNLVAQIASKGIPTMRLSERIMVGPEAKYLDVTDPTWEDDGQPHIFYVAIWGKFQDVSKIAEIMSGAGSWFTKFVKLAGICFETDNAAVTQSLALAAIDQIPGIAEPMNTFLTLDWEIAPPAPNEDGSQGPGKPINGIDPSKGQQPPTE